MKRLCFALASLALVVGCTGRPLGPDERPVPVANLRAGLSFAADGFPLCPNGMGWGPGTSILHGAADDPRVVWMSQLGKRVEVGWPSGYSARFTPQLELLDNQGRVIAHEGSQLHGGCQSGDPDVWLVELARQQT